MINESPVKKCMQQKTWNGMQQTRNKANTTQTMSTKMRTDTP